MNWNNNEAMSAQGYKMVYKPEHPNARKAGWILEHRFVMSNHLGRPLLDTEIVHHINGDKLDNRIENLEIIERPEHARFHGVVYTAAKNRRIDRIVVNCLNCGNPFETKPGTHARATRKYCCKSCQFAHMKGEFGANFHHR